MDPFKVLFIIVFWVVIVAGFFLKMVVKALDAAFKTFTKTEEKDNERQDDEKKS